MNDEMAQRGQEIILKYIGGGAFVIGIPAKDLTAAEVKEHGGIVALVATGLYERVKTEASPANAVAQRGQKITRELKTEPVEPVKDGE